MIKLTQLGKTVGVQEALVDLSFDIADGERVALVGLRGSGKSLLLQVLCGYTPPSRGEAVLAGFSLRSQRTQVKQKVGYAPREAPLIPELTVQEYLSYCWDLRGLGPPLEPWSEILKSFDLKDLAHTPVRNLTRGSAQQLNLAQAVLHEPRVLLMDDIFIDLDVLESFRLQSLLKMHAKDRTFLLATHDLPLARELCERVLLLDQGRLCFDGSVEDIQKPEFFLPFYQQREVPGEKTSRPLAP